MFRIKRIYAQPASDDGCRVLVDRLWPRGISKDAAMVDLWLKEIAPSAELRKWFGHDEARWPEFTSRYLAELRTQDRSAAVDRLRLAEQENRVVTLLYAARETAYNHAAWLRDLLNEP